MNTIVLIALLQIAVLLLTGCSQLDNKMAQHKNIQGNLTCQPVDAVGCTGWAE
jgi:outer membrane biogenesis lipoprotein LolB